MQKKSGNKKENFPRLITKRNEYNNCMSFKTHSTGAWCTFKF